MKKLLLVLFFSLALVNKNHSQDLHLYGGQGHDEYLGCLNCNAYDSNSIWNAYGTYGSEYNSYSPWNRYSSTPPVVVDKAGKFYGYFTRNSNTSNRAEFELALTIYKYYDLIMDDVSKWYDKLF
jgi:hypothetical protein